MEKYPIMKDSTFLFTSRALLFDFIHKLRHVAADALYQAAEQPCKSVHQSTQPTATRRSRKCKR